MKLDNAQHQRHMVSAAARMHRCAYGWPRHSKSIRKMIPDLDTGQLAKQRDARWYNERGIWRYLNVDGSEAYPLRYALAEDADTHDEWRRLNGCGGS